MISKISGPQSKNMTCPQRGKQLSNRKSVSLEHTQVLSLSLESIPLDDKGVNMKCMVIPSARVSSVQERYPGMIEKQKCNHRFHQ